MSTDIIGIDDVILLGKIRLFDKVEFLLTEDNQAVLDYAGKEKKLCGWIDVREFPDELIVEGDGKISVPNCGNNFPESKYSLIGSPDCIRIVSENLCLDHIFLPNLNESDIKGIMDLAAWDFFDHVVFHFKDDHEGLRVTYRGEQDECILAPGCVDLKDALYF